MVTEVCEAFLQYSNEISLNLVGAQVYQYIIKPKAIIFHIFKNIFESNYIQFNMLKEAKPEILPRLFKVITNLIFSIKLEDIIGYISKLNPIYYVIKVIFCYHIDIVSLDNEENFDKVIQLAEDGLDSLDNTCIILTHSLVQIFNLDIRMGSETSQ
jgi:hypothetical protein